MDGGSGIKEYRNWERKSKKERRKREAGREELEE
jgi:hypothetical protein